MSVWWRAVCPEKKEKFEPGGWRERDVEASAAQLTALMMRDWVGCGVVMINDAIDETNPKSLWMQSDEWPNRWQGDAR